MFKKTLVYVVFVPVSLQDSLWLAAASAAALRTQSPARFLSHGVLIRLSHPPVSGSLALYTARLLSLCKLSAGWLAGDKHRLQITSGLCVRVPEP